VSSVISTVCLPSSPSFVAFAVALTTLSNFLPCATAAEPLASNRPAANASSEVVCRSVMAKLSLCEPKAAIIPRTFYLRAGAEPMRTVTAMKGLLVTLATAAWAAEDERDKKVAEQKKQAEAAWKSLEAGDFAFVETKHLLVYAPKESEKQLKAKAATLESYHDKAVAATGLDVK